MKTFYAVYYLVFITIAVTAFVLSFLVLDGYISQLLMSGLGGIALGALFIPLIPSSR